MVMTREPGDLPERSHPSSVRGARMGRTSAVVTHRIVTRRSTAMCFLMRQFADRDSLGRHVFGWHVFGRPDNAARAVLFAGAFLALAGSSGAADLPVKAPPAATAYDWTGLYVGGHIGYAAGSSHWSAMPTGAAGPALNGSLDLFNSFNAFNGMGSYFAGFQAG